MRIRSLLLGVVLAAGLAGCTTGHDLPTISGAPSGTSDLETVAKAYYDCMTDAGIEVQLVSNSDGQTSVVMFMGEHEYLWRDGDGVGYGLEPSAYDPDKDPTTAQRYKDFTSTIGEPYELLYDGLDESTTYQGCLMKSGYDETAAWGSNQMDPVDMQNQIDADNAWAACVRDNGWPDVNDVSAPPEHSAQLPTVILPYVITEDQLRQLLEACPPVSQEDSTLPPPVISFDSPTVTYDSNGTPDAEGQIVLDKLNSLQAVLQDAQGVQRPDPSGHYT